MLEGRKVSEVAKLVGVSWTAVKRWKVAIDKQGLDGLAAKPHPGKPPRLSTKQLEKLVAMLKRGPLAAGYETNLWTCPRVAELIRRHFGVSYHAAHVWKILAVSAGVLRNPSEEPASETNRRSRIGGNAIGHA